MVDDSQDTARNHAPDRSLADKVVGWCLHAILFLIPIAISNLTFLGIGDGLPLTFDQFDIVRVTIIRDLGVIALGVWGVDLLVRGGKIRWTPVHWLMLAVVGWFGLTSLTSIHWQTAVFGRYPRSTGFISLVSFTVVYFLVVQWVDSPRKMKSLLRALFLSGTVVAVYGALQYLGIEPNTYGPLSFEANRSFATFGNPDLLGGFIVFMLPLGIALALSEESTGWRAYYWLATGLCSVVWVTAFTRGAWIGGVVALAVLAVAAWRQKVRLRPVDGWLLAAGAVIVGAVVVRSLSSSSAVMNVMARVLSIFDTHAGSAETRLQIWGAAIEAIKDRPLLGYGRDTFRLVFPLYRPAEYIALSGYLSVEDSVHNHVLRTALSGGLPALILEYGLFGWILFEARKGAFGAAGKASRILYAGVFAAVVGHLVFLFFGVAVAANSVIMWAMLGLLVAPAARDIEVRPVAPALAWSAAAAIAVVSVVALVISGRFVIADHAYMMSRVNRLPAAQEIEAAKRAVRLNPFNATYRAGVALAYFDAASETLAMAAQDPAADAQARVLLEQAQAEFESVIDFIPAEHDNYTYLANTLNNLARLYDAAYYEQALAAADAGIELDPLGPALHAERARALEGLGRADDAIAELEYALKLDPADGAAAIQLAQILALRGNLGDAIAVLEGVRPTQRDAAAIQGALQSLVASRDAQTAPVAP